MDRRMDALCLPDGDNIKSGPLSGERSPVINMCRMMDAMAERIRPPRLYLTSILLRMIFLPLPAFIIYMPAGRAMVCSLEDPACEQTIVQTARRALKGSRDEARLNLNDRVWQIIANPDVEHHNSYATFTIDGEKKDCYLVFLTDSIFKKPGDTFFNGMYSGIVPLDGSKVYRIEEVDDFWEIVGHNTDYAEDPEEVMATDFAYAITRLDTGYEEFENPEILEKIIAVLKKN